MSQEQQDESLATVLLQLADSMQHVLEASVGYRQKCVEAGFSAEAAERMAVDYHGALVGAVFAAVRK